LHHALAFVLMSARFALSDAASSLNCGAETVTIRLRFRDFDFGDPEAENPDFMDECEDEDTGAVITDEETGQPKLCPRQPFWWMYPQLTTKTLADYPLVEAAETVRECKVSLAKELAEINMDKRLEKLAGLETKKNMVPMDKNLYSEVLRCFLQHPPNPEFGSEQNEKMAKKLESDTAGKEYTTPAFPKNPIRDSRGGYYPDLPGQAEPWYCNFNGFESECREPRLFFDSHDGAPLPETAPMDELEQTDLANEKNHTAFKLKDVLFENEDGTRSVTIDVLPSKQEEDWRLGWSEGMRALPSGHTNTCIGVRERASWVQRQAAPEELVRLTNENDEMGQEKNALALAVPYGLETNLWIGNIAAMNFRPAFHMGKVDGKLKLPRVEHLPESALYNLRICNHRQPKHVRDDIQKEHGISCRGG